MKASPAKRFSWNERKRSVHGLKATRGNSWNRRRNIGVGAFLRISICPPRLGDLSELKSHEGRAGVAIRSRDVAMDSTTRRRPIPMGSVNFGEPKRIESVLSSVTLVARPPTMVVGRRANKPSETDSVITTKSRDLDESLIRRSSHFGS